MNSLIVFASVVAAVLAAPTPDGSVEVTQDTLGSYNLRYALEGISRNENRDLHGNVKGQYTFIDPHGIERSIGFTSGVLGYNAHGSDIPVPVHDTPEVAHAKLAHLATLRAAEASLPREPLEISAPGLFEQHEQELPRGVLLAQAPIAPALIAPAPIAPAPIAAPIVPFGAHVGIPDTPEVLAARAEHFAAHAAARAHLAHHF